MPGNCPISTSACNRVWKLARVPDQPTQASSEPIPTRWLQSITTDSCSKRAAKLLDDAFREYTVAAWASAEASAWDALELIATGVDVADRRTSSSQQTPDATARLEQARTAMREARDFALRSGPMDRDQMAAFISSHQTPVLHNGFPMGITPAEAADRYLDYARLKLSSLAATQVQAAQAMDLIAAINLGRQDQDRMPTETALCLRRAALQGQPSNASLASKLGMQLADMGLDDEAAWTLQHAMNLAPNNEIASSLATVMERRGDRNQAMQLIAGIRKSMPVDPNASRVPDVIHLSPQQFASISPAHNVGPQPAIGTVPSQTASAVEAHGQQDRGQDLRPVRPLRPNASTASFQPPAEPETTSTFDQIYSAESYRSDRDASYYRTSEKPSTLKRMLGKMPKLPRFW